MLILRIISLSITSFTLRWFRTKRLSIMTLSIKILSQKQCQFWWMSLFIEVLSVVMLGIQICWVLLRWVLSCLESRYDVYRSNYFRNAECPYAKCRWTGCHGATKTGMSFVLAWLPHLDKHSTFPDLIRVNRRKKQIVKNKFSIKKNLSN
jgi:hypothetical protein